MLAVIRVRGTVNVAPKIKKTLEYLRLLKPHNMVLVDEKQGLAEMVFAVKDFVAFGEIDEVTLEKLLEKRGRLLGDKKLGEGKEKGFAKSVAKEVLSGKKTWKDFGLKLVFRLNSPKKGFERLGVKKTFKVGGVLGYRGKEINGLLVKMM